MKNTIRIHTLVGAKCGTKRPLFLRDMDWVPQKEMLQVQAAGLPGRPKTSTNILRQTMPNIDDT